MAKKDDKKSKALEDTINKIQKTFGKESVSIFGEKEPEDVDVISTGSLNLDLALGVRGIPIGRIIELFGEEGTGKTTIALHCMAEAQKAGYVTAMIDAEHAVDPKYARAIGVRMDDIVFSQPDSGEEALEIIEALVRSGEVRLIVVDSVAALTPQAELDGQMGDAHVGLQARMMSQAMRKLRGAVNKNRCALMFINQTRMKIGVMFGDPTTTPGGKALKFYASVRMKVWGSSKVTENDEHVGRLTKVKVIKNKVAPPFRTAEFNIEYGHGIDYRSEILSLAIELCVVDKNGSWYKYKGENIAQGEKNVVDYWRENPSEFKKVENEVLEMIKIEE